MKGTIKELTEQLNSAGHNVSAAQVNGFVRVMAALGKVKIVGKGEKPKRGRVADVFEVSP